MSYKIDYENILTRQTNGVEITLYFPKNKNDSLSANTKRKSERRLQCKHRIGYGLSAILLRVLILQKKTK